MNTTFDKLPGWPKKSALQRMQEMLEHQMRPLRQFQELQDQAKRALPDYVLKGVPRTLGSLQEIEKILERSGVTSNLQDIIDRASIGKQAQLKVEQYLPKVGFATIGLNRGSIWSNAGLDSFSKLVEESVAERQVFLDKLRLQTGIFNTTPHFAEVSPTLRAIEEARKSLDRLIPSLSTIDFSVFESNERAAQETKQAAHVITQAATEQESFQKAIECIVHAIQAQQKPSVQLMLWLFFRKIMDWLIAAAIGAAMSHYSAAVLGESPQAAKKAVQEEARAAVGSPQLLLDYRFVSAQVLIVRQNPRARSPEIGRLHFGRMVKLLEWKKDFSLVQWTDPKSGVEMQGWVFSRYLNKFN